MSALAAAHHRCVWEGAGSAPAFVRLFRCRDRRLLERLYMAALQNSRDLAALVEPLFFEGELFCGDAVARLFLAMHRHCRDVNVPSAALYHSNLEALHRLVRDCGTDRSLALSLGRAFCWNLRRLVLQHSRLIELLD